MKKSPPSHELLIHYRLSELARLWGGTILMVTDEQFKSAKIEDAFSASPFETPPFGVFWDKKEIWSVAMYWPALIHEMAHTFACETVPYASSEPEFFGWEYVLALQVCPTISTMVSWHDFMKDYSILWEHAGAEYEEYRCIKSRALRRLFLQERVKDSTVHGLIKNGIPIAIR